MLKKIALLEIFLVVLSSYVASVMYGYFHEIPATSITPWLIWQALLGANIDGKFTIAAGVGGIFFCGANYLFAVSPKALYGNAHFANYNELTKGGYFAGKGILLGRAFGKYLWTNDYGHTLITAPTRSGKGVGFVIPNLFTWGGSAIVLDLKGENFRTTSGFRAKKGHRVIRLSPFDTEMKSHCFNPFDQVRFGTPYMASDLDKLAHVLMPDPIRETADSMWNKEARHLFIAIVSYLDFMSKDRSDVTMGAVYRLIHSGNNLATELNRKSKEEGLPEDIAMTFRSFIGKADKEQSGVKTSLNAAINSWAQPLVDAITKRSDFQFSDLRKHPTTIYICARFDELAQLSGFIRMMFQLAISETASQEFNEKQEHEILMLIDEFPSLGRMGILEQRISDLAGFGIRLMLIVQNIAQMSIIYGEAAKIFTANCHVRAFFAPDDQDTLEMLSKSLGDRTIKKKSRSRESHGGNPFGNVTVNTSEERRPLMYPHEIKMLPADQLLILRRNQSPVKAQRITYYKNKTFKSLPAAPVEVPALKV